MDFNIYLIKRKPDNIRHDEYRGFVVAAENARFARNIAACDSGDEGEDEWLNPDRSTVTLVGKALPTFAKPRVILDDYLHG